MAILFVLTFVAATLLSWLVLAAVTSNRKKVEKRLRNFSGGYSRPVEVEEDGDPIVASVRSVPARAKTVQKPKDPIGRMFWTRAQNKRKEAFLKQIVDALTLMSSSLRAGYSFLQSMETVATEMPAPLGEEFGRAVHEMSLGATVEESLEEMVERVGLEDLSLVVTAVLVQRQVGGNLAEVLENIAHTIRERIRIQGEIKALTAQGRISGWIVGMLPLALAVLIGTINPGYMSVLFTNPIGWVLLAMGLSVELIGVLIIRKIIQIEV